MPRSPLMILLPFLILGAATFRPDPLRAQAVEPSTVSGGAEELPYLDDLPPLVDREVFFGDPEISGGQLSPDGRWVSFVKPLDGIRNVWVKGMDEPFEAARPMTADSLRPIQGYFWSQDSKAILFVQDQGGNENFHVYAVDPATEPAEGMKVPAARDLTPLENVRAAIYAVPENDPGHLLIGLTTATRPSTTCTGWTSGAASVRSSSGTTRTWPSGPPISMGTSGSASVRRRRAAGRSSAWTGRR